MKIINFEYNDGTAPLSIERSKVKKITFYVPDVIPFTVGDVTFNMVKVEAGTFIMGATAEQYNPEAWEKPAHQVTLTKDYYMGETEVTQALWEAVMGSNPSSYVGDQLPVTQVSYNDITGENGFISKLNEATGKTFRLPTEAEWEFAARGGNQSRGTQYSGSANIDEVAWYKDNSNRTPHEVATKAPNEIGLYDMTGNVSEWCSDWYELYSNEAQIDPTGPESGDAHVFRDGTFATSAWHSRLAYRDAATPTSTGGGFGFRLAGMQLGADAASKSKISVEYNDGSAPLLIDRLKVKRITLTEDEVITVGDVTFNMIKVKAGTFTMGATSEQQNSYHDEHPTHQVTLNKDY